jgi:hypothetical protein
MVTPNITASLPSINDPNPEAMNPIGLVYPVYKELYLNQEFSGLYPKNRILLQSQAGFRKHFAGVFFV